MSKPKFPKLKEGDLIEIQWNDFYGEPGWKHKEDGINSPGYACRSVGFFIGISNDGYLITTSTMSGRDNKYGGFDYYPVTHNLKIRKIK